MKHFKRAIVGLLCFAMLFGLCNVQVLTTKAATKPTLEDTNLVISLGKQPYTGIYIYNQVKGATYTYTSSNKKIVTVSKKGVLTGIKTGKAKITVTQTYKKKKTKVGTCNIEVKAAKLNETYYEMNYRRGEMSDYDYYEYNLNNWSIVDYPAIGAKYTYTSSDSSILKINKDGVITEFGKPGKSVTITVKETYKKKTRTVGKFTVKIRVPALSESEIEIGLNESFYPYDYFTGYSGTYYIVNSDHAEPNMDNSNVVDSKDDANAAANVLGFLYEDGYWYGALKGQNLGTAYVHCYAATSAEEISADTYIGTIKVTVKEMKATSLSWEEEYYDTDDNGVVQVQYWDEEDYCSFYYNYEPYNCSDPVTVTSSDTNVAVVDPDSYKGKVSLIIKGEGTTTITVKLGDFTLTKTVKFIKSDY
ncbi:Ig-like domain-containing protein [Anaerosporobacter faecicola]|uniref:Ig-like domain-containing protein n=1 Tax=Anaerosporobacter faecicola TaxID=2718714 RepID=UPI001439B8BB|nr:Ig-like domain-containing protein [Anaerosporobacter faecicola]